MFLATTALSEFWDRDQEIIFLGTWCLRYDRRNEWEGLKYHVMPSPRDDLKRVREAAVYLDECGDRMLSHLTDYLNSVHSVSHSKRYWRILIGPWLLHHLHAAYDRHAELVQAFTRYPNLQTIVLDPQSFWVPRDTMDLINGVYNDPYNLQIFSQQLQEMGYEFPARKLRNGWPQSSDESKNLEWAGGLKNMLKWGASLIEEVVSCALWGRQIALCSMGFPRSMLWTLAWRTNFRACPLDVKRQEWSFPLRNPIFDQRRKDLAVLPSTSEFERVFVQSLPRNFPTVYLEAYQQARAEIIQRYRTVPSVIISAYGWWFNEPLKFLAAEAQARGSRLVAMQHGGGYGIFQFSAVECHESRLADSYMVWGWADAGPGKCRNLPAPKLSSLLTSRPIKPADRKTEKILFVSSAHLRYLLRFHPCPLGIQDQAYFRWQLRFLAAVPDRIRRALLFRAYPKDYGHATCQQISARFADIKWDESKSFVSRMRESPLAVIDHCGTTFLETLQLNVPTILFWDTHWTEVMDEAEPYFEGLRKVGILWDSPKRQPRRWPKATMSRGAGGRVKPCRKSETGLWTAMRSGERIGQIVGLRLWRKKLL